MEYSMMLAQVSEAAATGQAEPQIVPIDFIYEQITSLTWLQAIIAVSFGIIYLLYGWRIFKALTVISFALLGLYLGMWAGGQFDRVFLGGVIGLVVLAVLSVPLMRWAVSVLGAVAGGVLTAGVWYGCQLPEQYIWAGGLVGVVAGGMISFIVFKIAVMLFSSLGGAAIMATGLLSLLYQYEPATEHINDLVHNNNWFLPAALLIPTIVGMLVQNKLVKGSQQWDI